MISAPFSDVRLLALGLIVASIAGCHRASPREPEPSSKAESADDIIARYYRAIGGHDRLAGITTRHMWGTYSEGSLTASTDIVWKRPMIRRVNVHAPGFDYAEGFDGKTWEYNFQKQQLVVDTGAAADAGRRGAEFDESFVDYRARGHTVELLGAESLEPALQRLVRVGARLLEADACA